MEGETALRLGAKLRTLALGDPLLPLLSWEVPLHPVIGGREKAATKVPDDYLRDFAQQRLQMEAQLADCAKLNSTSLKESLVSCFCFCFKSICYERFFKI